MSYGHNNYNNNYNNHRRINEEEVPESKHTIFIRGLPGSMHTDEVKDYFEDKIGPVSFDFVKVSPDNQRLFVAVRFDSRDDAKQAMNKYCDRELMGYRCELTWFKDIRRFAQYQQAHGGNQRGGGNRGRAFQNTSSSRGGDKDRHRHTERRRSKSRSRSRSRSKSSSSRSRSRSSRSGSRSRSPPSKPRKTSRSSSRGSRGRRSPSSDYEKGKKKKDKKSRRSKKSSSSEPGETKDSDEDINIQKLRAGIGKEPTASPISMNLDSRSPSPIDLNPSTISLPPVVTAPLKINIKSNKITQDRNSPANVLQNTAFSIGMDDLEDAPPRMIRKLSADSRGSTKTDLTNGYPKAPEPPVLATKKTHAAALPPPPVPPCLMKEDSPPVAKGTFKSIESAPTDGTEPPKKKIKQEEESPMVATEQKSSLSKCPTTNAIFAELRTFQANLISKVKVEPKEEEFGGLRLSSLSRPSEDGDDEESKTELREQRLVSLNSMQMERFKIQKKKLEAAFKNDCETFVFVTQKLLAKDESLEQSLRMALIENMEDLEKQMMEKVDSYLAANC